MGCRAAATSMQPTDFTDLPHRWLTHPFFLFLYSFAAPWVLLHLCWMGKRETSQRRWWKKGTTTQKKESITLRHGILCTQLTLKYLPSIRGAYTKREAEEAKTTKITEPTQRRRDEAALDLRARPIIHPLSNQLLRLSHHHLPDPASVKVIGTRAPPPPCHCLRRRCPDGTGPRFSGRRRA